MNRRARVVAASAIAALGAALGLRGWLLRDPTPHFDRRHGRVIAVEQESRVDSLGTRETHLGVTSSSGLRVELAIRRPSFTPDDSGQVRRPLFLILGGHERGKGAGALIGDTRGAIFASMELGPQPASMFVLPA